MTHNDLASLLQQLEQAHAQRAAVEERLRAANEQLEQRVAERTAELTATVRELENFSYTVSHDLRAPLRAIDGYANIVIEDERGKLAPDSERMLGQIGENARRLGRLIDGLLSFTRLSRADFNRGEVDLDRLVLEVAAELQESGVAGNTRFEIDRMGTVWGDRELLRNFWMQLLGNAVKFSSRAGRPRVHAGLRIAADGPIFFVEDNGVGFDMRFAGKLFGVFQRLHHESDFEGTGVGLAIARRIAERHGGRIWAEGRPDEGATFYFSFPRECHGDDSIKLA